MTPGHFYAKKNRVSLGTRFFWGYWMGLLEIRIYGNEYDTKVLHKGMAEGRSGWQPVAFCRNIQIWERCCKPHPALFRNVQFYNEKSKGKFPTASVAEGYVQNEKNRIESVFNTSQRVRRQ